MNCFILNTLSRSLGAASPMKPPRRWRRDHSISAGAEFLGENQGQAPSQLNLKGLPSSLLISSIWVLLLWPWVTSSGSRPFLGLFFRNLSPTQCLVPFQPEATFSFLTCLCLGQGGGPLSPQEVWFSPVTPSLDALEYDPHAPTGKQTLGPTAQIHFADNPSHSCHIPLSFFPSSFLGLEESFFFFFLFYPRMNKIILSVCFRKTFLTVSPYLFIFNGVHYSTGHPLQGFRILRKLESRGKRKVLSASFPVESSSCSNWGRPPLARIGAGGGAAVHSRQTEERKVENFRQKCLYCRLIMQLQS